jgi:hypothetical protein
MAKEPAIKNKITEDTALVKILENSKASKILAKYNLPCLGCPIAVFEMESLKIGKVCEMYNINLESLLEELNKNVKK